MKFWGFYASIVVLSAVPSVAQQLPNLSQKRFATSTGVVIEVQNTSKSEITAFEARYKCNGRLALAYHFDTLLNLGSDLPMRSGAISTYTLPRPVEHCEGGVVAAIFSDGHNEGDVQTLLEMRAKRTGALAELQAFLGSSEDANVFDPKAAARDMRRRSDQVSINQALSVAEREGHMYILGVLADNLDRNAVISVPSDKTTARIPSASEMMKISNVPMETARTMVAHRRVMEWVSAFTPSALGEAQPQTASR